MKPTCTCQRCQRSTRPSSVKPGTSGCVISSGRDVVAQRGAGAASKLPLSGGIGTTPWSSTRSTSSLLRSTSAITPSTGWAHSLSPGCGLTNATQRPSRRPSPRPAPKCPAGQASTWTASKSVMPRARHRGLELGVEPYELLGLHQLGDDRHRLDVGPPPPAATAAGSSATSASTSPRRPGRGSPPRPRARGRRRRPPRPARRP